MESSSSVGQSPSQSGLACFHLTSWMNKPSLLVSWSVATGILDIFAEGPLEQAASTPMATAVRARRKTGLKCMQDLILWCWRIDKTAVCGELHHGPRAWC